MTGIGSQSVDQATAWLAVGFGMLSLGRDLAAMLDQFRTRLDLLRGHPR